MNPHEHQLIVPGEADQDNPSGPASKTWASVLSQVLSPLPATVAATVLSALVAPTKRPWLTLAVVALLFGGVAVAVVALMRWTGGPGSVTRRRAVPVVLIAELVALAVGYYVGVPTQVFRAFAAFFVVGLIALAGARANVSAHGLMAGALVGLLLVWIPLAGYLGLAALAALATSRVVLRQHTVAQAVAGAAIGSTVGMIAALAGA